MTDVDLLIVGAGIVGAHVAHQAARLRPDWNIILVDRGLVGGGATRYSAGLDMPFARNDWRRSLGAESCHAYDELLQRRPDLPVVEVPFFVVCSSGPTRPMGFPAGLRIASTDERNRLKTVMPEFSVLLDHHVFTGFAVRYGIADQVTRLLVDTFLLSGKNRQCWEGVAITDVKSLAEARYQAVTTDGRQLVARRVVTCTGPWFGDGPSCETIRSAGVRTKKVVAFHMDREPSPEAPAVFFPDEDAFYLPLHHRRQWLLSINVDQWDCDPDMAKLVLTESDLKLAHSVLERYSPGLIGHFHSGRVFCDGYGPDRSPVVMSAAPDHIVAVGGAGSGYRLAPAMAKAALNLLTGIDHTPLRTCYPERFLNGK